MLTSKVVFTSQNKVNTGPVTFDDGSGGCCVRRLDGTPLQLRDLVPGQVVCVSSDGVVELGNRRVRRSRRWAVRAAVPVVRVSALGGVS